MFVFHFSNFIILYRLLAYNWNIILYCLFAYNWNEDVCFSLFYFMYICNDNFIICIFTK